MKASSAGSAAHSIRDTRTSALAQLCCGAAHPLMLHSCAVSDWTHTVAQQRHKCWHHNLAPLGALDTAVMFEGDMAIQTCVANPPAYCEC